MLSEEETHGAVCSLSTSSLPTPDDFGGGFSKHVGVLSGQINCIYSAFLFTGVYQIILTLSMFYVCLIPRTNNAEKLTPKATKIVSSQPIAFIEGGIYVIVYYHCIRMYQCS